MAILQQIINSLVLGSTYALIAIGVTMIYGVLRILHIANAGVYVAGAYLGLLFWTLTHSLALAMAASMLLSGIFGLLIERFVYRPMIPLPRIVALIASIGLFVLISDLARIIGGPHEKPFSVDMGGRISVGGLSVSGLDLLILASTAVIFAVLWFIMNKSKLGYAIRAISQDQTASKIVGINIHRAVQGVFFIGSAISGAGGVLVGILYNAVYPSMGDVYSYKTLAIVTIGGFGSLLGSVLASLFLGVMETFMTTYTDVPLSREGIAMLFLILLILFRPYGILGKE
jgi:branched-chain amino acid transport system permease protein